LQPEPNKPVVKPIGRPANDNAIVGDVRRTKPSLFNKLKGHCLPAKTINAVAHDFSEIGRVQHVKP
jgi:hypothetical protein